MPTHAAGDVLSVLQVPVLPALLLSEDILLALTISQWKILELPGLTRGTHSRGSAIFHLCQTSKKGGFCRAEMFDSGKPYP